MKILITAIITCWTTFAFGQDYPFAKNFVNGNIILKDSSQITGQIKWYPDQNEKLKFRKNENATIKKYSPEDLIGFTTDSFKFASIFNFDVFADNYALLGKTIKVKQTFGQLLDSGSYNIYFVMTIGYNALAGGIQAYPNFLFQKKADSSYQYAAFPFAARMRDKRYEQAKENLYIFFKDYPEIIEKIKSNKQQDNFFDIIDLMKKSN